MPGILNGIRVLDMTRYIAGPYCGMLLADAGAEVIKVEKINGGDDTRQLAPWKNGISLYFPAYNRNKKSVAVDFRSKEGIALIKKLVAESDVLIQNFRAGTMEKMGLGYDSLKEINPRLIMASVSGFGQSGPYRDRPAFDNIIAAMASVCRVTEYGPFTGRGALNDYMAAMYAAMGILLALIERENIGKGQHLDVSMFASSAMLRTINIAEVAAEVDPEYIDRDDCAPYGWAQAKDGWIAYHAGTDIMFNRLLTICDEPVFHEPKYRLLDVPGERSRCILSCYCTVLSKNRSISSLSGRRRDRSKINWLRQGWAKSRNSPICSRRDLWPQKYSCFLLGLGRYRRSHGCSRWICNRRNS